PTEDVEAFVGKHFADVVAYLVDAIGCQEGDAGGIRTRRWQLEANRRPIERVGHLHENARAITGIGLGARGAAVVQATDRSERLLDEVVPLAAGHVDDEADTA